ncbi:MAG: phage tail protein [Bradyrhizobium sp.]|uniref:phage tail protein n=1 Tax=Bradyrhizobium sp. TaxID=376 RepID=UPI003D0F68B5
MNASFSQITSNGLQLISPLTGTLDADGKTIILDADADSNLAASSDDILNLTLQSFLSFIFDGNVASPVNGITFETAATGVAPRISAHGETDVSLELAPKGAGDINLRAGGTETDILVAPSGSETDIALRLQGKGSSKVQLGDANLAWPDADGTAGQALLTDGAGAMSFGFPIEAGFIAPYGGTGTPTGWLECNGQNVSRTTYAALFTAIGTTWGVGDGSTTFTLPDLRRRALVGKGGSGTGTLGNAVGNTGGAETVSIEHTHDVSGTTSTTSTGATIQATNTGGNLVTPDHTHTFSDTSSGMSTNTTPSIIQPSAVVGWFIKT